MIVEPTDALHGAGQHNAVANMGPPYGTCAAKPWEECIGRLARECHWSSGRCLPPEAALFSGGPIGRQLLMWLAGWLLSLRCSDSALGPERVGLDHVRSNDLGLVYAGFVGVVGCVPVVGSCLNIVTCWLAR